MKFPRRKSKKKPVSKAEANYHVKNKAAFGAAAILSAALLFTMLAPFSSAIIIALIASFMTIGMLKKYEKWFKNRGRAVTATIISAAIFIFIPLTLFLFVSIDQVSQIVNDVNEVVDTSEIYDSTQGVTENVNEGLGVLTNDTVTVTDEDIQNAAISATRTLGEGLLNFVTSTFSSLPATITSIILFFFVYAGVLAKYEGLLAFVKKINPLGEDMSELYLDQAGKMTTSMVKGQFIVALAQGFAGAFSLWVVGLPYIAFFALLLSLLSIVPLGGGIITMPIGAIMILTGNIWQGIFVLLFHFIVVTNLDNFIRPKLVPSDLRLPPALTLISVFAGVGLFGFIGIVVGPVLFILGYTTLDLYGDYQQSKLQEK